MQIADESYTIILIFAIAIIIMSIIIMICFRYHENIIRYCKRNQVAPETVYLEKPPELKLEIKLIKL